MYSFESRIRYSEVNKDKQIDLSTIINYFQDCSTFQSEDIGMGLSYLEEKKRAWLLNSWQIQVHRFPTLGEYVTTSTWAYDFKSMYGYRNFLIADEAKQVCAVANSIWVLMDMEHNRPIKVTPEDVAKYNSDPRYDMNYAPRKIELPETLTELTPFPVIKSNIDTNGHVNNGQYIKMAEEFLPSDFVISQLRAEYRMSALLGDTIHPKVHTTNQLCTVVLADSIGKPYTVIEFERRG